MFGRSRASADQIDTGTRVSGTSGSPGRGAKTVARVRLVLSQVCLLYTSDAADE